MYTYQTIGLILLVVGIIVQAWYSLDMRSILRALKRKNTLSIEGKWDELEAHYASNAKTGRPFVRFHHKFLLPGGNAINYALFLHQQGRSEEALASVDLALRQIESKPRIFRSIYRTETVNIHAGALRSRILILTGLGRYDEAREVAAQLNQRAGVSERSKATLFHLEYVCGHLDEALAQAQAVVRGDKQFDAARGIMAMAYCLKGEYDLALSSLVYEPNDISNYYSPGGLARVSGTSEGAELVGLQRQKVAGVFLPAQLIFLARVYIERKEFKNADQALDQAEKLLGPSPGIQMSYSRRRATSAAAQGKEAEAATYIERMRGITQKLPKRPLLWEMHFTIGRCYLYLERFRDALPELVEAQRLVLHPVEKHSTAFWMARAYEGAGQPHEAVPFYQAVVADAIPSRMRVEAIEALARRQG